MQDTVGLLLADISDMAVQNNVTAPTLTVGQVPDPTPCQVDLPFSEAVLGGTAGHWNVSDALALRLTLHDEPSVSCLSTEVST